MKLHCQYPKPPIWEIDRSISKLPGHGLCEWCSPRASRRPPVMGLSWAWPGPLPCPLEWPRAGDRRAGRAIYRHCPAAGHVGQPGASGSHLAGAAACTWLAQGLGQAAGPLRVAARQTKRPSLVGLGLGSLAATLRVGQAGWPFMKEVPSRLVDRQPAGAKPGQTDLPIDIVRDRPIRCQ